MERRDGVRGSRLTPSVRLVLFAVFALAFADACVNPSTAFADSYRVGYEFTLNADGNASVADTSSFFPTDPVAAVWRRAFTVVNKGYDSVEILGAYRPDGSAYTLIDGPVDGWGPSGTYRVEEPTSAAGVTRVAAYNFLSGGHLTVGLRYRLLGGVRRYVDGAVFDCWAPIAYDASVETVEAIIHPPSTLSGSAGVKVRLSGNPAGTYRVGPDGTVTLRNAAVPAQRSIGVQVAYPAAAFASAPLRVGRPAIARRPAGSSLTLVRRNGIARFTLGATVAGPAGLPMRGVPVVLQVSRNGVSGWSRVAIVRTDSTGRASRPIVNGSASTRYYRWYLAASEGRYLSAQTARQKVVVR